MKRCVVDYRAVSKHQFGMSGSDHVDTERSIHLDQYSIAYIAISFVGSMGSESTNLDRLVFNFPVTNPSSV